MPDPSAIPFAEALFEAATEADALEATHRDLTIVVEALASSRELARALFNPAFPLEAKRRILGRLTQGSDPTAATFLLVLLNHGRLDLLVDAYEAFADRYLYLQHKLAVHLTTAIPLDDTHSTRLREQLEQATGHAVTVQRRVDESIIGGVVIRVRDLLVDASIRRRLDELRLSLTKIKLPSGGEA